MSISDIAWLVQQGVVLPAALIPAKIADHQRDPTEFADLLRSRTGSLKADSTTRDDFLAEMRRFLPVATVRNILAQATWWDYLTSTIDEQARLALAVV